MALPRIFGEPKMIGSAQEGAVAPESQTLQVRIPGQIGNNWCWSAVASGIGNFFYGSFTTQCELAEKVLKMSGQCCVGDPRGGPCDVKWNLYSALAAMNCMGPHPAYKPNDPSYSAVAGEIDDGRPVGVRVRWPNGDGHFVAVTGYQRTSAGSELLIVQDPLGPQTVRIGMADLANAYSADRGRWTHTYYTVPRDPESGGAEMVDLPFELDEIGG